MKKKKRNLLCFIVTAASIVTIAMCYYFVEIKPHMFEVKKQVGSIYFNDWDFPDEITNVKLSQLIDNDKYSQVSEKNTEISIVRNDKDDSLQNIAEYDVKIVHTFSTFFGKQTITKYGNYTIIRANTDENGFSCVNIYSPDDKTNGNGNIIIKKEPAI